MATLYKKPKYMYIENAAKRKYGRRIYVIGTSQYEINQLLMKIKQNAISATPPEEVGQAVVDINCKSHVNQANGHDAGEKEKPADWFK